jgi:thioredoxin-dependent peroxiredoxin
MEIGKKLPAFERPASRGRTVTHRDFAGKKLVVYFYPKDATPGCTLEAQDFRDLHAQFVEAGVEIVGVSRDSVASHDKFCEKQDLPFTLISDPDESLCNAFGVIGEKNMYGRKVLGVIRSTFLFDAKGVLRHEWRGVRVKDHAAKVLEAARAL